MYKYGKTSQARLATVDQRLASIFTQALALGLIDISVTQGARGKEEQNKCFLEKKSKCEWPDSKHNCENDKKSLAIDAAPYVNGKISYDHRHCCFLAGVIRTVATGIGHKIRWGGNWDMDGEPMTDQDFQDLLHYEIIEE